MYGLLRLRHRAAPSERFDQRADMCSLCDALHADYGISSRALNNYDAIALATLTAAQNPALRQNQLDPVRGACTRFLKAPQYTVAPYFEMAASVSILLSALRLGDYLTDAKGWTKRLNPKYVVLAKWLKPRLATAQSKAAEFGLAMLDPQAATLQQEALEKQPNVTVEELASITAEWLAEIMAATARLADRPENEGALRELGRVLGRQIYIFDALDDLYDDLQSGDFNALLDTSEVSHELPRAERVKQAAELGERLLIAGMSEIANKLEAIKLEENSDLVRRMLLDNRMTWALEPIIATLPEETKHQLPLINRTANSETHECHTKKCKTHKAKGSGIGAQAGVLGLAIGLAALPLQMNGCDCCCDCCAAEGDAACCCLEIECCNCCCDCCGGGGGGRRYYGRRGGYYDQYPPNYPPPGYGRRRGGWRGGPRW